MVTDFVCGWFRWVGMELRSEIDEKEGGKGVLGQDRFDAIFW
jgi:hypothetical protein